MKLKKHVFTILLVVLLFLLIGSVSATDIDANNTQIASASGNDEILSMENDVNILSAGEYTYNDLKEQINSGGDIILIKGNYTYAESDGGTIEITTSRVIDGNGAVIDMAQSGHRAFYITTAGVTIKNLTIKNANYKGSGGAIYFSQSGTVENCNFINNTATDGGAVYFRDEGNVRNCNFTNNKATANRCWGGAVFFWGEGNVRNCNFINNTANPDGGAVYFRDDGNVTNCNFTNNKATGNRSWGGAVYFEDDGKVTNCSFTGNKADFGSAIYFYKYLSTDTLSISNSIFLNNRANAKDLQVTRNENNITITFTGQNNFLNAIYSRNDTEVTFTNVTYWSAKGISNTGSSAIKPSRSNKEAGQNITVSIVVNDILVLSEVKVTDENGMIVLDISVGENYFIGVRHDTDSYYTEATYTTSNNIKFNVNVTSQTTTNRTVNITAKSNIPNEIIDGKLLFILPNGTEINATYATNGIWWTLHTFDDVGDYNINATYIGLDDVTINNATISIRYDARVNVNNKTLDLFVGDNFTIVATTTPEGLNVTYVQDDSGVYIVDENGVVTALKNGTGSVLVKIGGDGVYAENSTIVNITVSKVPTEIKVTNATLDLKVDGEIETGATLIPADAGNLTYTINNPSIVKVEDGKIIALKEGNATITVSFTGNKKYLPAENKTIIVTVSLNDVSISVNNDTLDLFVDDVFTIVATTVPGGLNVTYVQDDSGVYSVDDKGVVTALKNGTGSVLVKVGGDGVYVENTTIVTVSVSKIGTEIYVANETVDLKVNGEVPTGVTLTPADAGNVTYTISNSSVVKVENGKIIGLKVGNATITVSFAENIKYLAAENKTINVTVRLNDVSVSLNNDTLDLFVDDVFTIVATTVPGGLNVTYVQDDSGVVRVDNNGVVTALKEGNATIIVKVGGGDVYAENTTAVIVTVKKVNATMNISASEITEGENATISVTLHDDATGNVTTTVDGKSYYSPVENGNAIITIPDLEYGNYTLPITYSGDDKYNPLTKDVNLTVKEDEIIVSAQDLTKYYSGPEPFTVNVAYANGRVVEGKEVKITVNGVTYRKTTDENGTVSLNINLNAGTYDVAVEVDNITADYMVTVLSTINASDIESKTKTFIFTAVFIDGEGNYLTDGTNVSFNIKGVIYDSQVTGDKGSASINLTLDRGRYIITSYNPVSDEYASNSIAVDLKDVVMTLFSDEITVGENATIIVTLPGDASGNVTAVINGKTYNNHVNDGKASIIIPDLIAGIYPVPVKYSGDNKYNGAKGDINVTVNKADATIGIDAPSITEGDNAIVTVTLPGDATGRVTVGNEVVTVKEGTASVVLTGLTAGITTVPVTYSGDDKYNPIETSVNVTVNSHPVPPKEDLNVSVVANPITVGEDAFIVVNGLADATGNVSAVVNGKTYNAPINDGKATITVPGLTENATALISYPGDDKYNNFTESVDIVVNPKPKENATMNIDVPPVTEGQNATVNVELPKDATGNVTAVVGGKTYTASVKDGKATITIPELAAGNYNVPVTYSGDNKYNSLTEEVEITVDGDKSDIIEAPDVTKYFSGPERFVVTVTDYQGKPLANKSVTISINGRSYERTTDANGTASIALGLNSGVYNATVTADNKTINSVVTILSTVNGTDIIKVFRNGTQYFATFRDGEGNYLKDGETVIFNIHGVMYERKVSGDKGLARLNINLEAGEYIITAMNPVTGDMTANNITVLSRITENADLVKYYRNASQYTVKVIGDDGKAVGAGENVTFNINGVFYTRQTDANGTAKLNINLQPGDYIITSEYKGCLVSNSIKVLPILSADDLVMKYRDGSQFKAKLVDGQGKPYVGQSVQFNVNGVLYNRISGSDGMAKLNINLMPGEYIITSSYNGSSIGNKITIRG